jgi:hypothetical protein
VMIVLTAEWAWRREKSLIGILVNAIGP